MRYLVFFLITSIVIFTLTASVWSKEMHKHPKGMPMHQEEQAEEKVSETSEEEIVDIGNKVCPVMGAPVNKDITYVREGKRYYFCCSGCVETFKQNPEKYIQKIRSMESDNTE